VRHNRVFGEFRACLLEFGLSVSGGDLLCAQWRVRQEFNRTAWRLGRGQHTYPFQGNVCMAKRLNQRTAAAGSSRDENRNGDDRPPLRIRTNDKGQIFSHIRQKWLAETPEERVRQAYVDTLHNEYGFNIDQMGEELQVTSGRKKVRADIVIWRTAKDKADSRPPLIVVECKSDNVTICVTDYEQGENYARTTDAPFFVTHNNRETRYWRVKKDRLPGYVDEIENIPHADASDKEIQELIAKLKTFKEDEFADLLHSCHNVIRNREHLDPAAAFDEIAKVLFVKVWVERELRRKRQRQNLFTVEWLESQLGENPLQELFRQTKEFYREDRIFDERERLNLKYETGKQIVQLLERYNLSDTSEDVKGIAFERFLGKTFRGEIGQFFTPRSIVEFMVRMVEPKEGDKICDPASGSGGFLIRFFDIVRQQILADADQHYKEFADSISRKRGVSETKKAELLREKYDEIQATILQQPQDNKRHLSRIWKLSNTCIFGTDANDRMARTSKMNMILHGDGHGGVHHHNGFVNVNGVFEERFDVILTNPPFGANVEPSDVLTEDQVAVNVEADGRYRREYGDAYRQARAAVEAAKGEPIASLFELPKRGGDGSKIGKVKTEILFIERCLALLRPGGRLGIVLPEGIFNNPSLAYVREFCEDRSRILAVVSLPQETFYSSGASVKASLLFLQKYTEKEQADFDKKQAAAQKEIEAKYADEIAAETTRLEAAIEAAKKAKDAEARKSAQGELRDYLNRMADTKTREARALLKERFDYPIFLYEAEKVGITATGEPDANELYPNDRMPAGMTADDTCLEQYRRFRKNPKAFALEGDR
jgi:type I restriction enzyme M protein